MATKICAVIGNFSIAELVANAPVLEAHTVIAYVLALIGTPLKVSNWIGKSNRVPVCSFPIPATGLQVGQLNTPYLYVITDSFGIFGLRPGSAKKPITCSTELQSLVEGKAWLSSIKTCAGQGIAEFNEWLSNPARMGFDKPPVGGDLDSSWPPYAHAPTTNAVVVVPWCGNEFCKTIYKDEDGNTVPKPESKKKQGKNAPYTSEHSVTEDPGETFFDEVKKFIRFLSYYRFPIVVGPGDGESWRIEDSSSWNLAVNRVVTMLRDAGIPVLNPADYIKSHARRDDWHPADTIENRLMQAQLFADASYVARGFGFLKQIRHNRTAISHSYNHWPGEFFPPVGGDPDSREQVRALVAQIEENVKNSRTSAATARMSAEAVARARSPPAATAPATSSAPTQPKAKMVATWAPSLPTAPLPPLQAATTPQGAGIATIAAASTSDDPDAPGQDSAALSLRFARHQKRQLCSGLGAEGDFRCDQHQHEDIVRA